MSGAALPNENMPEEVGRVSRPTSFLWLKPVEDGNVRNKKPPAMRVEAKGSTKSPFRKVIIEVFKPKNKRKGEKNGDKSK